MDDNRQKLQLKDRLLYNQVGKASECTQVDFRRRCDLLDAAYVSVVPVWTALDETTSALAAKRRRSWLDFGCFFLGALVVWFAPAHETAALAVGVALILGAAVSYAARFMQALAAESEHKRLLQQQDSLLFHWRASGASDDDFWRFRDSTRARMALVSSSDNSDFWRTERVKLDHSVENELLNIRHHLFVRASGDWLKDWVYDLDGVTLPELTTAAHALA